MSGSGRSLLRSSSYEKGARRAYGGRARRCARAAGTLAGRRRRSCSASPARCSPAAARCRPTSARPIRARCRPIPTSPLVRIAVELDPLARADRRAPAAARRLLARHPDPAGAARDELARRPVLRARERPDRSPADDGAARRERARRSRPPAGRRPLHDPFGPAAARPGVVPEHRGAPLQSVLLQPLAAASAAATRRRSSTSAGSTTACTTSSSSPTA